MQAHTTLLETLPVSQASPSRRRVETWLQEGGAPLSPRAYRARALAELSRSTTFLERRRAAPRAGGGARGSDDAGGMCGSQGAAELVGGARAGRFTLWRFASRTGVVVGWRSAVLGI